MILAFEKGLSQPDQIIACDIGKRQTHLPRAIHAIRSSGYDPFTPAASSGPVALFGIDI